MIQLNLLPDVKMEYMRAQRERRLIFTISAVASLVGIVLLGTLLAVGGLQKKHLSDLDSDIQSAKSELQKKPNVEKILTVQNQLNSLTGLHDTKPATSRLFGFVNQVTPANVNIGDLKVDFLTQTVVVTGATDSLGSVNKYIDTLKFTTYRTNAGKRDQGDPVKAFSNVVMSTFSIDSETKEGPPAKYSVSFNYDPVLFDITQNVSLTIPVGSTTRSALEKPTDLFQAVQDPNQAGAN